VGIVLLLMAGPSKAEKKGYRKRPSAKADGFPGHLAGVPVRVIDAQF
jgi:hypothetical protein